MPSEIETTRRSIALACLSALLVSCGGGGGGGDGSSPGPVGQAGIAATLVKVSGDGQTSAQHALVSAPLTVRVVDALGNPVAGETLTFSGTPAAYVTPTTATTDAQGLASWTGYLHLAGPQAVVATVAGLPPATFTVDVTPSGSPFDGRYVITYVTGPHGGGDTMRISGSDVYSEHPMEPFPYSPGFDQATGAIAYAERDFMNHYWRLSGALTLSPDGSVSATGSYQYESLGVLTGPVGTWSAVRM